MQAKTDQRPRLLIIDDAPSSIRLLLENLKDAYEVRVATSGAGGLRLAEQCRPDLILLDVLMPLMDGFEVLAALQQMVGCSSVPVIFLTSLQEPVDEERALKMGAVDFVTKPFHPALLKARIRNHLELKFHRDHLEMEVERRSQELVEARMARQSLENEVKLANHLQLSMLPPERSCQPEAGYEVAAYLSPARAIGGDFYDYIPLAPNRLLFVVGDVSDKGVAAALFMVRVVTILHWLGPSLRDPAQLLQDLNSALVRDNEACMFVTVGCGLLDLQRREIQYASAGHEAPLLLTAGQPPQLLEWANGPALGLFEKAQFPLHTLPLKGNQSLVLTSDGVTEAVNPGGEPFGYPRLQALLQTLLVVEPDRVVAHCRQALEAFTAGAESFDDQTILVIKPTDDLDQGGRTAVALS